jgi:integrase
LSLFYKGGTMSSLSSFDVAGRRRSPATTSDFHIGRAPGNKGMRYPADPPRIEEIVAVMRQAGDGVHGDRMRALIVVLWRAGLRVGEALDLHERDLEPGRGALLVREGKGGRRRESGWTTAAGNTYASGWATASRCPSGRCSA